MSLLTIAIPVFERTKYFKEALNSAINQTTPCQILVSDNGSVTNYFRETCALCGVNKVKYFRHDGNVGMFRNWNSCVTQATTEYLYILGDDDILDPRFAEVLTFVFKKYPEVALAYTGFKTLLEPGAVNWDPPSFRSGLISLKRIKKDAGLRGLGVPTISTAYRRDVLASHPWPKASHGSNDWVQLYGLPDDYLAFGVSEKLVTYRKHLQADTSSRQSAKLCQLSQVLIYRSLSSWSLSGVVSYLRYLTTFARMLSYLRRKIIQEKNAVFIDNAYLNGLLKLPEGRLIGCLVRGRGGWAAVAFTFRLCGALGARLIAIFR